MEYLDKSHILDKIYKIPQSLIIEIVIIILVINFIFSFTYYQIYKMDKNSFDVRNENLNTKNFTIFDFFYFSNMLFFSVGYDIVPKNKISRSICIVHMILGFLISTIFIAKVIN
jgi:uncharacterized membrane protein